MLRALPLLLLSFGNLWFLLGPAAQAQPPALPDADRVRLAEAFRLAEAVQDRVWAGWSAAPFAVLLVTPEREYLVRHPQPSPDFEAVGYDALLQSEVYTRARVFAPTLLATFPAVGGVPTIVVGQPATTGKASTPWVLTLLHEHFHQLQSAQPGYYAGVAALDLAGGDETGMWMLNYPFPYASPRVRTRFDAYRDALAAAVRAVGTDDFGAHVSALSTARRRLRAALDDRDARYLAFQLWQEGVARYTEHRVARAAEGYAPSSAFAALPDFTPYAEADEALRDDLTRELAEADLAGWQRVAFYPVGAAEALVLDAVHPGWQRRYLAEPFTLDAYFATPGPR